MSDPVDSEADQTTTSGEARPRSQTESDTDGQPRARWLTFAGRAERRLEETGTEPDPRFTFANERTFLAWNRTALALIAAGLAAAQLLHFNVHGLRLIIAVPLIVLGAVLAMASYLRWQDIERAMRLHQPMRYSWMPRLLTSGIALIALCGGILALVDRLVH